jgi:hypothetical protein
MFKSQIGKGILGDEKNIYEAEKCSTASYVGLKG